MRLCETDGICRVGRVDAWMHACSRSALRLVPSHHHQTLLASFLSPEKRDSNRRKKTNVGSNTHPHPGHPAPCFLGILPKLWSEKAIIKAANLPHNGLAQNELAAALGLSLAHFGSSHRSDDLCPHVTMGVETQPPKILFLQNRQRMARNC